MTIARLRSGRSFVALLVVLVTLFVADGVACSIVADQHAAPCTGCSHYGHHDAVDMAGSCGLVLGLLAIGVAAAVLVRGVRRRLTTMHRRFAALGRRRPVVAPMRSWSGPPMWALATVRLRC